jgi:hypothetical protein
MMHRVAAALAARGIDVTAVRRLPAGMPAEIAAEVGSTGATAAQHVQWLRKAGGDADRATELKRARLRTPDYRAHRRTPEYREKSNARRRDRYATDPDYRAQRRERRATDPDYRERQNNWRRERDADPDRQAIVAVDRAINSAKQRGVPHDPRAALLAHAERMLSLGTCPLTGIEFTPEWDGLGWSPPWRLSLDQIVPGLGETVANTRGVVSAVNVMLGQLPDPLVASYCRRWLRWDGSDDPENGEQLLAWRGPGGRSVATAVLLGPRRRFPNCTLTPDWVRGELSKGVCSVSGLPLTMEPPVDVWNVHPRRPSIDRIDCKAGYVPDNCRLVCWWYNQARLDWTDEVPRRVADGIVATIG